LNLEPFDIMSQSPDIPLDPELLSSEFCSVQASRSLRVTCYGSSSSKTPEKYLKEARSLGYILAKRGHVCVNGAGSYGCMAAMNDGVWAGNGHVIGVIHEMFLVDNGYWGVDGKVIRDGGAHQVFQNATTKSKQYAKNDVASPFKSTKEEGGPIREILVAGGSDLQERKKLLVQKCDALVVLPGGPGTWDELWEMACARHLNLNQLPIVCVNVDGYYEPFREILEKAYADELIKLVPEEIVHFASSAEEAIRWIEVVKSGTPSKEAAKQQRAALKHKKSILKRSSFFSASPYQEGQTSSFFSLFSFVNNEGDDGPTDVNVWIALGVAFAIGTAFGVLLSSSLARKK
jgi:predicted Rossmann-fold nucleotide-binding protein